MSYFVYGYHATDRESARAILEKGFRASSNGYDWLGSGIYFYQDAPNYARSWRTGSKYPTAITESECVVFRCRIEYRDWMDLCDTAWMDELIRIGKLVPSQYQQTPFGAGAASGPHRFDYRLIEIAVEAYEQSAATRRIRAVRSPFLEGKPIRDISHFFDRQHAQIAVRDASIVRETEVIFGVL